MTAENMLAQNVTTPKTTFYVPTAWIKYVVLIVVCLIVGGPILTAFLGSIRTTGEFQSAPFGLPQSGIQWVNYQGILESSAFWNSFKNSLIISASVTLLNVACGSMLAFVLSRVSFWGRGLLFNIVSLGLLFPLVIAILPIFIQVRQMGLINNLLGVILPLVAFGLPGSVVILRGFFISVPGELEDAAYIDGCTTFGFFRYILIPLARPALTAVAVLQVIYSWNEYFLPLLVLNDENLWPLPLGISQFQGQYGTDWARVMAYVCLLIIPAVLFYVLTEKYIVTGLTGGELKG
jgi:raffinose/stachyose/melibiose transport system permease protein